MKQSAIDSPERAYWRVMTDIKVRMQRVIALHAELEQMDPADDSGKFLFVWEQVALHLRKILELIVFGSLVAHQDAYAKVYPDLADHWRIGKILEKLEKVHPDFFPKPTKISKQKEALLDVKIVDKPRLTRDQLVWLYDQCGELLHAFQPLKHGLAVKIELKYPPPVWIDLIWGLLEEHLIRLADGKTLLLVQMAAPPDGYVVVSVAE